MKEIIRITLGLTISCLIAAFVMGTVFAITDKAKKQNERMEVEDTMLDVLGYGTAHKPAPSDLKFYRVYRYILEEGDRKNMAYMVPVRQDNELRYELVVIDLKGNFVKTVHLDISPQEALEAPERKKALQAALESQVDFSYADSTIIAKRGDRRIAYLLPEEFPGFKTFIELMLALDPSFEILGLEIMEHEEDPGLGGEIEQPYFKNQFKGKSFEKVKELEVVKEPLPEEYRRSLEKKGGISEEAVREIRSKYKDHDIYALTGATISSRAVTGGVKNAVKKFAYRLKILDGVISDENIPSVI